MDANLLWWLALGLLLGWLIEWLIDRAYWRRRLREFELQLSQARAELDAARAELAGRDEALAGVRLQLSQRDSELAAAGAARAADVERLAAELEAARADLARRGADLDAARAAGAAEVARLTAELEAANAEIARRGGDRDAAWASGAAEVARLTGELETARAELEAARGGAGRQGLVAAAALGAGLAGGSEGLRLQLAEREGQIREGQQRELELRRALLMMKDALARSRAETARERELRLAAQAPGDDPLIDIVGIGPVYQQRLYDAGVRSFAQLAALDAGRLREIVGAEEWQQLDLDAWVAEARARAAAVRRERDPLVDINGIGPVYEQRLFEAGVNTFAELAVLTPQRVREIVGAKEWQQLDVEAWIAEARELAIQVRAGTYRKGVA